MSNIQFGKRLKDIPIDKIHLKMRVAIKNHAGNYIAGTVCYLKKNTFHTVTVSGTTGVANVFTGEHTNLLVIDWDNGPVCDYHHSLCDNVLYIEESK